MNQDSKFIEQTRSLLTLLTNLEFSIETQITDLESRSQSLELVEEQHKIIVKELDRLHEQLELLKQLSEEQDGKEESSYLQQKVSSHSTIAESLKSLLQRVCRNRRIHAEKSRIAARKQLLEGAEARRKLAKQQRKNDNETVMLRSQEFSSGLQHTRELISGEIERSREALNLLVGGSKTIRDTYNEYQQYGSDLKTVVLWIVKKRVAMRIHYFFPSSTTVSDDL